MPGTCCENMCFHRHSDECKVSDNIEQFVTGRLIVKLELCVVEHSPTLDLYIGLIKNFTEFVIE